MKNAFVTSGLKSSAETLSGNGALKYSTTGDPFVDQFGKLGSYKAPRPRGDIERDCELLWAADPLTAVKFIVFLRMISRTPSLSGRKLESAQRGGELRNEGIRRMMWLARKSPETFRANLALFTALGSWRDPFEMLKIDVMENGWNERQLDWDSIVGLIQAGLSNENTSELVKKWLPSLRADSKCKTAGTQSDNIVAKFLCSKLVKSKSEKNPGSAYRSYRKLKSSGTAHEWQKQISRAEFGSIDFASIHGRALNRLVRSKFLDNQGLRAAYEKWVEKPETEAKFTGFVHELFSRLPSSLSGLGKAEQLTINKQFATLVEKGGSTEATKFIVVRDTSGSMGSAASGTNMSCFNIAKSLALYFSEFLEGEFANAWIEFNSDAKMHTWKGKTPLEKWYNDHSAVVGSTEFQSVIRLFARLLKNGVPESEFPKGILCISDGEFNPTAQLSETNVTAAKKTLAEAGFSKDYVDSFVIVLWNLQSRYYGRGTGEKFETYGNVQNVFYFSGYSASIVAMLTSKLKTARELLDAALSQDAIQLVTLGKA